MRALWLLATLAACQVELTVTDDTATPEAERGEGHAWSSAVGVASDLHHHAVYWVAPDQVLTAPAADARYTFQPGPAHVLAPR